jgi:hypothetical protein
MKEDGVTNHWLLWKQVTSTLVALTCSIYATAASAESTATVRIVPDTRLPNGKIGTLPDSSLPASAPFDLEVAAENSRIVGATVEVWPEQVAPCADKGGPPSDTRQYYVRAMKPSGTGGDRVLRARIPALQVRQSFCIRLTWQVTLDARDVPQFSTKLAAEVSARLAKSSSSLTDSALIDIIRESGETALRDLGKKGGYSAIAAALLPTRGALQEWLEARNSLEAALTNAKAAAGAWSNALLAAAKIKGQVLPAEWIVDTPGKLFVLKAPFSEPELTREDAAAIEKVLQNEVPSYTGVERKPLEDWIAGLHAVMSASNDEGLAKARSQLRQLPPLPKAKRLLLPAKAGWVPSDVVANAPAKATDVDAVVRSLNRLAKRDDMSGLKKQANAWLAVLKPLIETSNADVAGVTAVAAQKAAANAAEAKLMAEIEAAIGHDNRLLPSVQEDAVVTSAAAGAGTTPDVGNYVTPAVGIAVTLPLQDSDGRAWVFPHAGVNIYFTPVDRTIDVDQLVGQFWQRASLIAAISLKDVKLPAGQAEAPLFGGFPYLGIGYRVTQFIQANVGMAFYRYRDLNPASAALHWGIAPGAGISLDLDVLAVLKKGPASL